MSAGAPSEPHEVPAARAHATWLDASGWAWLRRDGIQLFVWASALLASAATIELLFEVTARRIAYPFEVEWMEGGSVDQVQRILLGKGLYVPPSLDFVPYTYTPLYFYVAASLASVVGNGFMPLRLISMLATTANLALVFSMARRETKSGTCGLAAAALFAATYRLGGAWFDVCRVDAFALALALSGVHLCRSRRSMVSALAAGALFWAAFFSKQSALGIGVAACVGTLFLAWRRGLAALAVLSTLLVASTAVMNRVTDGWYWFYAFKVPALHPIIVERVTTYFTVEWVKNLPVTALLAAACILTFAIHGRVRLFGFYASLAAGTVVTVWAVWVRTGSYDNILMPGHAIASLLAGIGIGSAALAIRRRPHPVLCLALLVQLGALRWEPRDQLPSRHDEKLGRDLVELIKRQEGDVWVVSHGWLGEMAGKPMHAQWCAMADTFLDPRVGADLRSQMMVAAREGRFAAIITDTHARFDELEVGYDRAAAIFSEDGFWPKTGWGVRPNQLWVRRGSR